MHRSSARHRSTSLRPLSFVVSSTNAVPAMGVNDGSLMSSEIVALASDRTRTMSWEGEPLESALGADRNRRPSLLHRLHLLVHSRRLPRSCHGGDVDGPLEAWRIQVSS